MLHFHSRYIATLARELAHTRSADATLSFRQLGSASAPTYVPLNDGVYASFPPPDATYDKLCRSAQALLRDLAGRVTELSNGTRLNALMRQLADSEPGYSRSLLYIAADAHRTETPVVEMVLEMADAAESECTMGIAREYEAQYATRAGASAAANIRSSAMAANYLAEMFRRRTAVDIGTGIGL